MSGMWTILLCIVALPAVMSWNCGGTQRLSGQEGVIVSHSSAGSGTYSNNLRCIWIVTGRPGKVVRLRFDFFKTGSCYDYLLVFDGPSTGSKEISTLCGDDRQPDIYSSGQSLTLQFRTDGGVGYRGFRIHYKLVNDCGGTQRLTGEEGIILSHPSAGSGRYQNNLDCMWVVTGRPDKVVRLHFDFFETEGNRDYLFVFDGPNQTSRYIKNVTGFNRPPDIFSSGQNVTLSFSTSASVTRKGFRIRYKLIYDCGGTQRLTEEEGVIRSHPSAGSGSYPNKLDCKWIVTGRSGKFIRLSFDFFETVGDRDYLFVYDGPDVTSRQMKNLSGSGRSPDIFSSGQTVTLRFITNRWSTYKGFRIRYRLITDCGGTQRLNKEEGVILSHPSAGSGNYQNNVDCKWIVTGRPDKVVRLQFDVLETEDVKDFLIVYDGADVNGKQMKNLSGSDRPRDIFSSGQSVTLRFTTDSSRAYKGFRIRYKLISDCGGTLNSGEERGVILSHPSAGSGAYLNNLYCKWIVTGRPGKVVRLRFDFFETETGSDFLIVYDGADVTSKQMKNLSGSDLPPDIFSSGQSVTLRFRSDKRWVYRGFRIQYIIINEPTSGIKTLYGEEGAILSHPSAGSRNYSDNVNFKWIIAGRPGKVVLLHFYVFSLEMWSRCGSDSLTVYDGTDDTGKEIKRLCGSDTPSDIYSSGESVMLKFKSDHSVTGKGFWIRYKLVNNVPTITTSPSGEVLVGTHLLCVADSSPPARVTLSIWLHGFWRAIATGINIAKYRLPLNTVEGNRTVRCIANNSNREDEKTTSIFVKKLPLPVLLDIGESLVNTKEQRNITCRTERLDKDLDFLQLYLSTHSVHIRLNKNGNEVEIVTLNEGFTTVTNFPYEAAGVTVLRPPTSGQAIQVILTATPRHNGCIVTCAGYSELNKGKEGKQTRTIQVRWLPSVRSLSVYGLNDSSSPVAAQMPATIRCELQRGKPRNGQNVSMTATMGGKDLGVPQSISDRVDEEGYRWQTLIWNHQFRREDNGASVVCGFEGEEDKKSLTVDVQYKPRSFILSPAREIFVGESINCSADANPPPVVKIEGFGSTARGVSVAYLAVPTTAKGRYNVSCTVVNSMESENKTVTIVAHKKRIPITFSVSQSSQDINSNVTLHCQPQTSYATLSYVNLTFAGGQQVFWKEGKVYGLQHHVLRQDFDKDRKSLNVTVRAAPFMRGAVQCQLQSADFSRVGVEERHIELKWKAEARRLFTRIENKSERDWMKEKDMLVVTCEVKVGSLPTNESVEFSGRQTSGVTAIGADIPSGGWTLRNVSTRVRLSWRHDGETIGCSLGGKTLTKRLTVEYAPRSLVIGPSLVNPGQAVRCTAAGRPTPTVRLRPANPQRGWTETKGSGTAELLVGKKADEKSYALVCEAKNRQGEDKRISAIFVRKNSVNKGVRP